MFLWIDLGDQIPFTPAKHRLPGWQQRTPFLLSTFRRQAYGQLAAAFPPAVFRTSPGRGKHVTSKQKLATIVATACSAGGLVMCGLWPATLEAGYGHHSSWPVVV